MGVAWRGVAWLGMASLRLASLCASRRRAKCNRKSKAALYHMYPGVLHTGGGCTPTPTEGWVRGRAYSRCSPKSVSGCSPRDRRRVSDFSVAQLWTPPVSSPSFQNKSSEQRCSGKGKAGAQGGERAAKAQGLKDAQETPTSKERAKGLESGHEEQWSSMDLEVWNKFVLAGNDRFVQY